MQNQTCHARLPNTKVLPMKAIASLGTVSAIVALAASAQAGGIIYSSVTNQPITLDSGIDLNNDGTNDINFSNSSFFTIGDAGANDFLIVTNESATAMLFSPGDRVVPTDPISSLANATNLLGAGISYLGFDFTYQGETHTGWLEVDFPTTDTTAGTLIAAAWASAPDAGITIPSAAPEPSATALALLGGLAAFPLWRRVKPHDSNRH